MGTVKRLNTVLCTPPSMYPAAEGRDRLWKGLERFVNCGDSEGDYCAVGRAFPRFWPVDVGHFPNQEETVAEREERIISERPNAPVGRIAPTADLLSRRIFRHRSIQELDSSSEKERESISERLSLAWHPACHKLFLAYRHVLREIWLGHEDAAPLAFSKPECLLGLSDRPEKDFNHAKRTLSEARPLPWGFPLGAWTEMDDACREILRKFPTAYLYPGAGIHLNWLAGDFWLLPENDFQMAFFLLFRQSWRARQCPRCNTFFVARKQRQQFCGTTCSAGSRLSSNRKWWRQVGAKRRQKATRERRRKRAVHKGAKR